MMKFLRIIVMNFPVELTYENWYGASRGFSATDKLILVNMDVG